MAGQSERTRGSGLTRPGWPEIVVALIAYLVFLAVLSVVILRMPDEQAALRGIVGMALNGMVGLIALAAAVLLRIRSLSAFGFRPTTPRWLMIAALCGVAAYGFSHLMEAVYFSFVTEVNTQADFQEAAKGGFGWLAFLLLAGAVMTPLGEEVVFRGVIANALNRYGFLAGVVGSAFIFAAIHGPSVIFLNAFLIGIVTGVLFRQTNTIWPALVVHIVFNGLWLLTYALI